MGLTVTLGNALSGMSVGQKSLEVLSRNVANAGTPGYHRQSFGTISGFVSSPYARSGGVDRAFSESLQHYYTREISDSGYANVRGTLLDRLQSSLGMPGTAGSLDKVFGDFRNALGALATSPDDFSARAGALTKAQSLVSTLNRLTTEVQALRQETEAQIGAHVGSLNQMLGSLESINDKLLDQNTDGASRATLMDHRDRLVSGIAELVDVQAVYREGGTVSLMTRAGVGLLDVKASSFQFQNAGKISAGATFDPDPALNGVGTLELVTPAGLKINLVAQGVLQSGQLAALIDLRDGALVEAQAQLDEIAGGLARAFSTTEVAGTAHTAGAASGCELDIGAIQSGNDFVLSYTQNGIEKTVKVVRVEDASKLPLDYVDGTGARVVGLSFSGGAAGVAAGLSATLTGLTFSSGGGNLLRVVDDGATGNTDVLSLTGRPASTALQGGGPSLALFLDAGNGNFTNSLDGKGQKAGFAGRIAINQAVLNDNRLLVQHIAGAPLGDSTRPDHLLDQLNSLRFSSDTGQPSSAFQLSGTVSDLIAQTLDYQGSSVASALTDQSTHELSMEALTQRIDDSYGVNVDEEMARLMELQNAYAANARIISVVQELVDALLAI